ncbi:unnamed protein product [Microthlaspi erraticum]|uniref:F-box domain-containing protein n=1 Tax=Microthlaspi erraticum TaxID=1685480 RepID=A0A6D2IAJ0_9BRAS|nr:unnamed protein product [Microthlaspi erraticum]
MKTRWRQYFSRALSSSTNAKGENSETISTDLITEILLRLPGKSVARCRCVSKLWNSTLRDSELCFYSAPQGESSSSPDIRERKETALVICKPSTGQLLPLPKVKTNTSFLGFDPTDQEFKVLTITGGGFEHRVLTLGTRKLEWRRIECGIGRHCPNRNSDGICINGGVYYKAWDDHSGRVIVCFDVRLEKCRVINAAEGINLNCGALINFKGKLGVFTEESRIFELWVLEDAERHEWSKNVLPLPLSKIVAGEAMIYMVGVAGGTDEVVWWPRSVCAPFYVDYYNMERNTFKRVEIKGMEAVRDYTADMTLDYVEDVKLMEHV